MQIDRDRDLREREKVPLRPPSLQLPLGFPSGASLLHLTGVVRAEVRGSTQVPSP